MNRFALLAAGVLAAGAGPAPAGEPAAQPRPVPLTRPEMKQLLEDMKSRKPRIPLPPLTDEEQEQLGDRAGYEARLRYHYAPPGERQFGGGAGGRGSGGRGGAGFNRERDPAMTLDNTFKVQLFWIVSRTNNCQY
jgi:hypothetical protein